jgi:hypothetical protein
MQLATTNRGSFAPTNLTEAITFSEMLANSNMVPKDYRGKPGDILVCVQWGMEIGLAPMQALQNITVINGKPSVYGDAMMALVQASSVCENIEEYLENEGTDAIAVCIATRKGRKPVIARFSVKDAVKANLWGKQGPWTQYPNRMLQMRARGFALRDCFPDVLRGLISAEEAEDYPEEAKPRPVKDITPRNPLDMVTKAEPVAIPVVASEPDIVEAELVDRVKPELVEIAQPVDDSVQPVGFALLVPGKVDPKLVQQRSVHQDLDEWADAYEELGDLTARAGKRTVQERLDALKNLRDANEDTLRRIDMVKRIRHTASYSQRRKALGAAQ